MTHENDQQIDILAKEIEQDLLALYGPMVHGAALSRVLGYPSLAAFRQAVKNKSLPVKVFPIKKRRGKFALVKEIARWVAEERINAEENNTKADNQLGETS